MNTSYGFRYTTQSSEHLYQIISIGHSLVRDESYVWNGLKRSGGGLIFQYTLKGTGKLRIEKDTYAVPQGHGFLLHIPGDHEYAFDASVANEWEFLWIRIDGIENDWLSKEVIRQRGALLKIDHDSTPLQLLWTLYEDSANNQLGDRYEVSLRIYEWLLSLQRYIRSGGTYLRNEIPDSYKELAQFMDLHYSDDLSLEQLADRSNMNKFHLCKMFPRYYQVTPMDYLRNRRIEKSTELLRNPHLKITEIAARCGYSNVSYFGKVFHKVVGVSPSAFREAQVGQEEEVIRVLE
ncbi:helix-turn-helix transcriptional regulator [Paenibacillus roseipurpureus]|uniref:AraC family transcriptional regulator n=1 Tax=Paenibacillus roseopurpureus TaxID=2918901 RepID=A0AA96LT24_9BACL|nr:AraC family transcriptional regulator [Paenibacillus sp. MBLB1832]WNR45433.1 AraC family transcriptional regulator [Paenibacillus sp. MBLB1832]